MPAAQGKFRASERDLLLSTVTKVGKSTGRNLRFLHLRARYALTQICGHIPHVRMRFPFSFCYRIVSAPVPLPLIITPNNASVSTVEKMSGSGARGIDDSSYAAKTTVSCERVVYGVKLKTRHSVRGFLNRRFKWRFWLLLPPGAKVTRPGGRNSPKRAVGDAGPYEWVQEAVALRRIINYVYQQKRY